MQLFVLKSTGIKPDRVMKTAIRGYPFGKTFRNMISDVRLPKFSTGKDSPRYTP
ncbi:hypothetical protein SAMN04488128_1011824 [Chitinophaga eiseniae]|uniref:Uncharacterized protein n=1 Tax=Chitinophaga eiseniae TaxID=634771 RepID=A0A1T4NZ05_9BACT|nr:hypothetical protein SAMN04488128_1011824 [Chitinophaga eiseniae]